MINLPPKLSSAYNGFLVKKGISQKLHPFYRKWLRYYLEFMQKQARKAVTVFYEMQADSPKNGGNGGRDEAGEVVGMPPFIEKLRAKRRSF